MDFEYHSNILLSALNENNIIFQYNLNELFNSILIPKTK